MIVIVGDRQTGRTTALLRWLIGGHPVDGWPGWSRVLIVSTAQDAQRILTDYPDLQSGLRAVFPPALGKVVISLHELAHVRRVVDPGVSFAVDNADQLIAYSLSVRPAVITLCGVAVDPDDPIDPGPRTVELARWLVNSDEDTPIPFRPTLAGYAATMPEGGA